MFARKISMLGACAAAMLASTAALAQISDDVVKIGVLTDMNGPAATPTGQGSVTAAQMAIDDFGGKVLGKPISLIVGDHQLKPDIGGGIARRWYDVDQVDLIVDVPVSAVGLAVQNIANEKKKLFITHSTLAADFHGKFCSPYAMQWVIDTRSLAAGTADAVVKRGGDSWFFITDDYAFGHSLERDASSVVTKNGGKVLGSVRPPLATPDLSSFVLQGMVKALFCQDEPDADDVAGRCLFLRHVLPQRRQGHRHRRAAEGRGKNARKADRGFLLPQRQAPCGQSDGA